MSEEKINPLENEYLKFNEEQSRFSPVARFYKSVFDNSRDAVLLLDRKAKIIATNKRLQEWLGYENIDLTDQYLLSFDKIPSKSKVKIIKSFTQRILGKEVRPYKIELETYNGDPLLVEVHGEVIHDENGRIAGVMAIISRVSNLITFEPGSTEYESVFEKMTELAGSAVFVIQNDRFQYINPAGYEILGYTPDEIQSLDPFAIIDPSYRDVANMAITELTVSKKPIHNIEIYITTKSKAKKFLNITGTPTTFNGRPAILGTAFDITSQKLTENKYQSYAEELKLLNANKDKFFSIIAHDLKSPFSALLGYSDFLVEDFDELSDEEIREYSNNINTVAKNVYDLLDNLLEWSRIQTGRRKYEPETFNLTQTINRVIELFYNNAVNKNLKFHKVLKPNLPVFADTNMLFTVLRNLVSNAIKFTPRGGSITITASNENHQIIISVKDSGVGISEDDLQKLFNITTSHSTIGTEQETGTGLGLILCKELVELNNGTISLESELGKGSEFKIILPEMT